MARALSPRGVSVERMDDIGIREGKIKTGVQV